MCIYMKSQKNIKNWITLGGLMSLYVIMLIAFGTVIFRVENEDSLMSIFTMVFKLFSNIITAVVTFYFTRKSVDSAHSEIRLNDFK